MTEPPMQHCYCERWSLLPLVTPTGKRRLAVIGRCEIIAANPDAEAFALNAVVARNLQTYGHTTWRVVCAPNLTWWSADQRVWFDVVVPLIKCLDFPPIPADVQAAHDTWAQKYRPASVKADATWSERNDWEGSDHD
jgi:hypothetical protein